MVDSILGNSEAPVAPVAIDDDHLVERAYEKDEYEAKHLYDIVQIDRPETEQTQDLLRRGITVDCKDIHRHQRTGDARETDRSYTGANNSRCIAGVERTGA